MRVKNGNYIIAVREIMQALPGVTEGPCFGTQAFYVNKKLLVRFKEDAVTLVVYSPDRDEWINKNKEVFFITDHYRNYPSVLVHLGKISKKDLLRITEEAWRSRASAKLLREAGDQLDKS